MRSFILNATMARFLFLSLLWAVTPLCERAFGQVIVIANPSVKASGISKQMLHELFTGASMSLPGTSLIRPVLQKAGSTHEDFLQRYIGKSDAAFRASWRSLVFSGEAVMPRTLDPEVVVVSYVAHTPGAIGYIDKATPHEGVKILEIQ